MDLSIIEITKSYINGMASHIGDARITHQDYISHAKLHGKMVLWYLNIIFWMVLWIPVGMYATFMALVRGPNADKYENCLSYALRRWVEDDGYLVIRWCRIHRLRPIVWPHLMWLSKDDHANIMHYTTKPSDRKRTMTVPSPFFDGRVKRGDDPSDGYDS